MPIIQLCLGGQGSYTKPNAKSNEERWFKRSLHVLPSLSQSIPGPTFHLEELQGTRQHQVQTRICSELERGWKIERVRLQVPFYNHSAMKSSVNKVQTSQHNINSLSGLTPAYPSITVPCHTSTLPLVCQGIPVHPVYQYPSGTLLNGSCFSPAPTSSYLCLRAIPGSRLSSNNTNTTCISFFGLPQQGIVG